LVSGDEKRAQAEEIRRVLREKMREISELKERLEGLGETPGAAEKNLKLLEEIKVPSLKTLKERA